MFFHHDGGLQDYLLTDEDIGGRKSQKAKELG